MVGFSGGVRRGVALCVSLALGAASGAARAQSLRDLAAEELRYDELYRAANAARDRGEHARAFELAQAAARLRPTPEALVLQAREAMVVGDEVEAFATAHFCEQSLASGEACASRTEGRAQCGVLARAARDRVAILWLSADGEQLDQAAFMVDGRRVPPSLLNGPYVLAPGRHEVQVQGPPDRSVDRTVRIAAGETRRIRLVGERLEDDAPRAPATSRAGAWAFLGTGAALVAASVPLLVVETLRPVPSRCRFFSMPASYLCDDPASAAELNASGTRATIAWAGIGVGALSLGAGALWMATLRETSSRPPCAPAAAGVTCEASF